MLNTVGRLGPFALEERLSNSDRGSVYRAVHVQGQRVLAVKLLPLATVADDRATAAFTRQVGVLKSLQHRNLVGYYGGGKAGGQPYVALELVRGQSLDRVLERGGALPWQTVVEIGLQLCEGLEFCHQRWIIHQRLNPSQILWGEDGVVKVAGVGLAEMYANQVQRPRDDEEDHNESEITAVSYLAPEQITGAAITTRTDLYALGCILYELLTGRPPFTAELADEVREQHLHRTPPRVADTVFDCPVWLSALVAQLLEKDPAARPTFASAVAVALRETKERVAARTGVAEHCLSRSSAALPIQQSQREVRRMLGRNKRPRKSTSPFYESAWFLAGCAFLLLGAGVWALWPAGEQKLFEQAAVLMAGDNRAEWRRARGEFIEPLLERYPQGKHADQARRWIDQMDIDQAESKIKANQRIGRPPASEGERLYTEALRYEQFGDRQTAMERYGAMTLILNETGEDGPMVKLARRQVERLTAENLQGDWRTRWLDMKLDEADRLAADGNLIAARNIGQSIASLYRGNQELRNQVERAQNGLSGKPMNTPQEASEVHDANEVQPDSLAEAE